MKALSLLFLSLGLASITAEALQAFTITSNPSLFGADTYTIPCDLVGTASTCKIDTGVNISALSTFLNYEHYKKTGTSRYRSMTGQTLICSNYELPQSPLPSQSGVFKLEKVEVIHCPEGQAIRGSSKVNLLGLNAFAGKTVSFNFRTLQMFLYDEAPEELLQTFSSDPVGHILVPMKLKKGGEETLAMFDTGAGVTLVSKEYVKKHRDRFETINVIDNGYDTHGNKLTTELLIAPAYLIDEGQIAVEYVMAVDFSAVHEMAGKNVDFILGANWIRNLKWTFDLKNSKFSAQ